jgi:hypothetical protein
MTKREASVNVPWRVTVQGIARLVETRINNTDNTTLKSFPFGPRRCTSAARTSEGSQEFYWSSRAEACGVSVTMARDRCECEEQSLTQQSAPVRRCIIYA